MRGEERKGEEGERRKERGARLEEEALDMMMIGQSEVKGMKNTTY